MERLLYTAGFLALPIASAVKLGWSKTTLAGLASLVLVQGAKCYRDSSPRHMQQLHKGYLTRKILLNRLIQEMARAPSMTASEIARFQQEALHLIAAYVATTGGIFPPRQCSPIYLSVTATTWSWSQGIEHTAWVEPDTPRHR